MHPALKYLLCVLIGYFIGAINPSYLVGKLKGMDIREKGSGNAGASNAVILLGKTAGVLCALFDIGKAIGAVLLTKNLLFPGLAEVLPVTGVAVVLGHVFPFYMKFRGGKGLAALGGLILAYNWRVALIMLAAELIILFATDYICFVPITGSIAFPIIYGILEKDWIGALILGIITLVMLGKHMENLRRIRNKTELHFSFLWKPKKELERMAKSAAGDYTPEEVQAVLHSEHARAGTWKDAKSGEPDQKENPE